MLRPRLVCKSTRETTRLYLTVGGTELLRAALPSRRAHHPRAAPSLLEGLSLWLERPLSIVLCADAEGFSCGLGLCDGLGMGIGRQTEHYEVEVSDPHQPRQALGPFQDLRRLALRGPR